MNSLLLEFCQILVKDKNITIDKAGVIFHIMYENDKYTMTQYNNVTFFSKDEFLENLSELVPDDLELFEGENNVETAEKALLDFLNIYSSKEIDLLSIFF